jgi:type IV secretory pathway VirJ component
MMTMTQKSLQHVMTDPTVDTTLTMVAAMVGLSKDMKTKIVAFGLPMMADVADGDPVVFKAMYAQSVKYLPEPTPAFYAKLGKNAKARQALAADFQLIYGPKTDTINRDTASHTSITETQASQVLAATMPAVVKAVGTANSNGNEMGFGRQLRNLNA